MDGTAYKRIDYEYIDSRETTFNQGEVQKTIPVGIKDDIEPEGAEYFYLQVYNIIGERKRYMLTGLDKQNKNQCKIVNIFKPIIYSICFAQKNHLIETVLLVTHNICFG